MTEERLIPPTMLYRFAIPCRRVSGKWNAKKGIELDDKHVLPSLCTLDGLPQFADIRAGWSQEGMFFNLHVGNKQQSTWCRETQLVESDGIQIWIDTRDTHSVHRATRYCHWFLFLPCGGGSKRDDAIGTMLRINRSKDDPKTLNQVSPKVVSTIKHDGYSMALFIPGMALDGWNPAEHPKVGFHYTVIDRELGQQTLSVGTEFPVSEDPGLWQTLDLVD